MDLVEENKIVLYDFLMCMEGSFKNNIVKEKVIFLLKKLEHSVATKCKNNNLIFQFVFLNSK